MCTAQCAGPVSTVHMIEVQSLIDWEANVLMAVASVHYCLFHYCLVDNQWIKWRCICVFLYLHLMQSKVRFNVTAWWPSGAPQPLWPRKSSPLIYLQIQIKYIIYRNNWKYKSNFLLASHCLFLFSKVAKEHRHSKSVKISTSAHFAPKKIAQKTRKPVGYKIRDKTP